MKSPTIGAPSSSNTAARGATLRAPSRGTTPKPSTPKPGKAKPSANGAPGKTVETPAASVALAGEYGVKFTDATSLWIVRGKTGQVRLADKPIIALCLLNKAKHYPTGDAATVRDTIKGYRKTWKKLTPEVKEQWMAKAQAVFSPARKEYHAVVKPLAHAATNDTRFTLERFQVHCTKGGIVHVANRATFRPPTPTGAGK